LSLLALTITVIFVYNYIIILGHPDVIIKTTNMKTGKPKTMKKTRLLLALLLTLVLICSVTATPTFALSDSDEGTAASMATAAAEIDGFAYADATEPIPSVRAADTQATETAITVAWDANGGTAVSPLTRSAIVGQPIGTLPTTTRTGYSLNGWYTQQSGGTKITTDTAVANESNLTWYAQWTPNRYTLKLNINGGKMGCITPTKLCIYGDKVGSLPTPTKDRSYFQGWYTATTGGTKMTENSIFDKAQTTTLYARWKKATKLKLIFNTYGGTVSVASKSYTYDTKISKLPIPSRPRYDFMGWYTAPNPAGGTRVANGSRAGSQKTELQLYARWAPHQYFQHDGRWGGRRYVSSIAGSGCAPSTMSMVVYTLKGKGVTPLTAANYSIRKGYRTSAPGKTRMPFFVNFPKAYGIKSTPIYSGGNLRNVSAAKAKPYHDRATAAVKAGNWVVCFMGPGQWTHVGHFVLWYDIEGNRALVRDPNGRIAAKTRNTISKLQSQVIRYWIIEVPDANKLRPPKPKQ
jgi:uncharacterized repeat protein (TIGR02543 family)